MNPPSFWWCCLYPSERTVMQICAETLVLTLGIGIPNEAWDLAWLASFRDSPEYRDAFMRLYHLENGTLDIDGEDVAGLVVVEGYGAFWVEVALWLLNPAASCVDGCEQSQRPVM